MKAPPLFNSYALRLSDHVGTDLIPMSVYRKGKKPGWGGERGASSDNTGNALKGTGEPPSVAVAVHDTVHKDVPAPAAPESPPRRRAIQAQIIAPGDDSSSEDSSSDDSSSSDDDEAEHIAKRKALIARISSQPSTAAPPSTRVNVQALSVANKERTPVPAAPSTGRSTATFKASKPALSSEESEDESSSSSEDETAPRKILFLSKSDREKRKPERPAMIPSAGSGATSRTHEERAQESRKMVRDAVVAREAARVEKENARELAGNEHAEKAEADDTDGLNPEQERLEWKLRELRRVDLFG